MPYVKTALAAEALRQRNGGILAQRQRTALILFDGKRSVSEVLQQTAGLGVQREDISYLLENGLLHEDGAKSAKPVPPTQTAPSASVAKPAQSAPQTPQAASALTSDEQQQQQRYRIAYPLATQITATLGLRGFKLNLAVEKADGYAGLLELLPKIEAAAGSDRTAALRHALDGASAG